MKLFSKNSNACDHNSPTLQTDRQTDNLLWNNRAIRVASRGKKDYTVVASTCVEPLFSDLGDFAPCGVVAIPHCRSLTPTSEGTSVELACVSKSYVVGVEISTTSFILEIMFFRFGWPYFHSVR